MIKIHIFTPLDMNEWNLCYQLRARRDIREDLFSFNHFTQIKSGQVKYPNYNVIFS